MLGIVHAVDIVDVVVGAEADESVVRLGILLVDEVGIVGSDEFDTIFACEVDEDRVDLFLPLVDLLVTAGFLRLVALQLDIVVVAEEVLEPHHRLACAHHIAVQDFLG